MLLVIGIVGLPASGKTEVAKSMVKFGASCVEMGNIVRNETVRRGLNIDEKNVGEIANSLRRKEGIDAIAKHCISYLRNEGEAGIIVIDGIRGSSEVRRFRKEFGKRFYLVSVEAPREKRFERVKSRVRDDDAVNRHAFNEKDKRELSWGLTKAMELADFRIVNDGTLEELRDQVAELFQRIVRKKNAP